MFIKGNKILQLKWSFCLTVMCKGKKDRADVKFDAIYSHTEFDLSFLFCLRNSR